jgi:hypothetical protein
MFGRFGVSRMRFAHREAVVFLRKTILDTSNRPPTITDVVCVTAKVTKTTSQTIFVPEPPFIARKGYNCCLTDSSCMISGQFFMLAGFGEIMKDPKKPTSVPDSLPDPHDRWETGVASRALL